ncbi:hypothetical protein ACI8AA_06950 [Geodermatophilus sp. SYSU D01180]
MDAVDVWNAVGTWFGAIGTMAAVGLALGLAIRDARHRDVEQRERDAERRDSEAAQARTLTIETLPRRMGEQADEVRIRVANQGTLPFLAVVLENVTISPLDDGPEWRQMISGGSKALLAPGEHLEAGVMIKSPRNELVRFTDGPYSIGGVVSYRDAAGRAWRRWGNTDPYRDLKAGESDRRPLEQDHTIEHR